MARVNPYDRAIEQALDGEFGRQILERGAPIERRTDLSLEEFDERYRQGCRPVVLTDLGTEWPLWRKWDFSFLKQSYGGLKVLTDLYSKSPSWRRLSEVIDCIVNHEPTTYLQEWSIQAYAPELLKDFSIAPHFKRDWFGQKLGQANLRLWVGPKGATTWLHQDSFGIQTWNAQVVGKKLWFLFSPEFQPGDVTDFEPFLNDSRKQATHFVTNPGDIVFVPKGWWHRVRAVEPSINLSGHILDEEDMPRFVKAMFISDSLGWLNQEKLAKNDPGLVATYQERARARMIAMGLDPEDILGLEKSTSFNTATDILNQPAQQGELNA